MSDAAAQITVAIAQTATVAMSDSLSNAGSGTDFGPFDGGASFGGGCGSGGFEGGGGDASWGDPPSVGNRLQPGNPDTIITNADLDRQGTGDDGNGLNGGKFTGIEGMSAGDIIARVPANYVAYEQDRKDTNEGNGINFRPPLADGATTPAVGDPEVRIHGRSFNAPQGTNAAQGWTARVGKYDGGPQSTTVDWAGYTYVDNSGNSVEVNDNSGHIPIAGNKVLDNNCNNGGNARW